MDKIRIDKWLWSVRIFKSRSISNDACKSNKVKVSDCIVRPSSYVKVGNIVEVKKNGFNYIYLVKKLIEKRVSATLAAECYENQTSEEELNKFSDWFVGKAKTEIRERGSGRPTKRDRRDIDEFKESKD